MTDPESALLVGICFPKGDRREATDSLEELERLAQSAGATVSGKSFQELKEIHSATLVGRGKAIELRDSARDDVDLVVFDADLTPVQQRNLDDLLETKVLDRTGLILDIFAQRAHTKEGQIQVELAQLKYLQTRLTGHGVALSRLGGGIGTRGPGETKLEMDRRRIRDRISRLNRQLKVVRETRNLHRSKRKSVPLPTIALVGYTNSGKSTLLNHLTGANVDVEDRLFATLDPTTRKLGLPDGQRALVTDTVGFIRRLPHALVEAFKATFEEAIESDLLVHVVDFSHDNWAEQARTVDKVLNEMGAGDKPVLRAYNKVDLIDPAGILYPGDRDKVSEEEVYISATTGYGVEQLLWTISRRLKENMRRVRVNLPFAAGHLLHEIYERGWVLDRKDGPERVVIEANVEKLLAEKLEKMGYVE